MKKILLLGLIVAIICLNFTSAGNRVTYNAYYAELNDDGNITYTNTPVTDFDTVGYICLNSDCSSVGSKVNGLTKSTSGNSITLDFPTTFNYAYYGIWFYKEGYIHWERLDYSKGSGGVYGPYNIYFAKKEIAWAPIMNMDVVNEVNPNIPIEVGVSVGIDAETYSAIENAGPLKYNPVELNLINVVNTTVTLKIKDSSGNLVDEEEEVLQIPYSQSKEVFFNYSGFSQTGKYILELITTIDDLKIINSLSQIAKTEIRVIPANLTDYSFSLISGLNMTPASPERNENIDFSFDYVSNYVDVFGLLTLSDTNVSIKIYNEGNLISEDNLTLSSSINSFDFNETFSALGNYSIVVEGMPAVCFGINGCLNSLQEISFIIKDNLVDTTAPEITVISPVDGATYTSSDVLLAFTTNENADAWFILNGGANISLSNSLIFEYNLTGLNEGINNVLIYAKDVSNNQRSISVSFLINLTNGGDDDEEEKDSSRNSAGLREVVYDGNPIVPETFVGGIEDTNPIKLNLNFNKEDNNLTEMFLWILFIFILILLVLSGILLAKKII